MDLIFPEFETHMNKAIESVGPLNKFHNFDDDEKAKKTKKPVPSKPKPTGIKQIEPIAKSLYFP